MTNELNGERWTAEADGAKLILRRNHNPESPREGKNVIGRMVGRMDGFDFFDFPAEKVGNYDSWETWRAKELPEGAVAVPIYAYRRHANLSLSPDPYAEGFDAPQVGYNFISLPDVRKWYGRQRVTQQFREKVEVELREEIEELDEYLNGEYYNAEFYVSEQLVAKTESHALSRNMLRLMLQELPADAEVLANVLHEQIFPSGER